MLPPVSELAVKHCPLNPSRDRGRGVPKMRCAVGMALAIADTTAPALRTSNGVGVSVTVSCTESM
jgi:hypothetical protein